MGATEVSPFLDMIQECAAKLEPQSGRILWVSSSCEESLGIAAAEIVGTRWVDHLLPEDKGRAEEALDELVHSGKRQRDLRLSMKGAGGVVRPYAWALAPGDEARSFIALVARDLSHELALIEHKAALKRERELFVGGPVILFRWRNAAGWPVEYVSPNIRQFGIEPDDLISGRLPYATIVHPEDLARVGEEVGEFSKAGVKTFEQDYRLVLPDGRMIWIYDFTVIRRNEAGEITHYEGYVIDITERKEAEEELRSRMALIESQREAIQSLSSPVIEIWDGVLVLPVVGVVDTYRAATMTELLLDSIVRLRSQHAILDLTGVEHVDTSIASHLIKLMQAVRLLGARCLLCGLSPSIAQTLVALSIDLGGLMTFGRLRDALSFAIRDGNR